MRRFMGIKYRAVKGVRCQNPAKGWIGLALLILLLSVSWAARIGLEGTHYPLQWGLQEGTADNVIPYPPPVWGNPTCFQKGSTLTLRLIPEPGDPQIQCWKLVWAELRSKVTGEVYWRVGESNCVPPSRTIPLPHLPDFIDWAKLQGEVVMVVDPPPPPPGGLIDLSASLVSDIFIVLNAPEPPMDPAWVSALKVSCSWAQGRKTALRAATALTQALHTNGNYNGGFTAYTRYLPDPDTDETFYLHLFLARFLNPAAFWGQCNDFADFLVCLNASVGGKRQWSQRTHSLVWDRRETTLPDGHAGRLITFTTHSLDAAPFGPPYSSATRSYHQFTIDNIDTVWDGNIAFEPFSSPGLISMPREPDYRDHLLDHPYLFWDLVLNQQVSVDDPTFYYWEPTPDGGFIPQVTTANLPP